MKSIIFGVQDVLHKNIIDDAMPTVTRNKCLSCFNHAQGLYPGVLAMMDLVCSAYNFLKILIVFLLSMIYHAPTQKISYFMGLLKLIWQLFQLLLHIFIFILHVEIRFYIILNYTFQILNRSGKGVVT